MPEGDPTPRHLLDESKIHRDVREKIAGYDRNIVEEVRAAVAKHDVVAVGVYSGLRAGELHGLSWDRLRWDARSIVVARSRFGATKGGRVRATHPLVDVACLLERRPDTATRIVQPASCSTGGLRVQCVSAY